MLCVCWYRVDVHIWWSSANCNSIGKFRCSTMNTNRQTHCEWRSQFIINNFNAKCAVAASQRRFGYYNIQFVSRKSRYAAATKWGRRNDPKRSKQKLQSYRCHFIAATEMRTTTYAVLYLRTHLQNEMKNLFSLHRHGMPLVIQHNCVYFRWNKTGIPSNW